jgi:hypothetical protein
MAATVITSGNITQLLMPGVNSITSNYPYYFNEWKMIFTIVPTLKNAEIDVEVSTLNGAAEYEESGSMPKGTMKQAYVTTTPIKQFGISFTISQIALEDNLYPDEFPKGVVGCKENLRILSEYKGIALFDNAFAPTTADFILGDGQPMCSFNHPLASGVNSNRLNPADLNETSAQDAIKVAQYMLDYSGLPRKIVPKSYLVGIENQYNVQILTGSAYRSFDSTNAINPLTYGEYLQGGYILSHYMQNPDNWFLLTSFTDGLVWYQRKSLEVRMSTDQATQNIGVYSSERYAPRCINYRSVVGVPG